MRLPAPEIAPEKVSVFVGVTVSVLPEMVVKLPEPVSSPALKATAPFKLKVPLSVSAEVVEVFEMVNVPFALTVVMPV